MSRWADTGFGREVDLRRIGEDGTVISKDDGEARLVYEPAGAPGWVVKLYKRPPSAPQATGLAKMISVVDRLSPEDLDLVARCSAWPAARVVSAGSTVGVVMPKAPDRFLVRFALGGGRQSAPRYLNFDWLAQSAAAQREAGVPVPDVSARLRAARDFLALGALLSRHDLVYGDWSHRNAFWAADGSVFLIDMDSCEFGSRPWVLSPGWDDPLYPAEGKPRLDLLSDRYKLAVLTVRCLTGQRGDPWPACDALPAEVAGTRVEAFLRVAFSASTFAKERPRPAELLAAVEEALLTSTPGRPGPSPSNGNVVGSRPVGSTQVGRVHATVPQRPSAPPPPQRRVSPVPTPTPVQRPVSVPVSVPTPTPVRTRTAQSPSLSSLSSLSPLAPPEPVHGRAKGEAPAWVLHVAMAFLGLCLVAMVVLLITHASARP